MRTIITFAILIFFGCNEPSETSNVISEKINKEVGHEIPLSVAQRWINSYEGPKATSILAKKDNNKFKISACNLNTILKSVPDPVGLAFYHSSDQSGQYHFLVTAFDQDRNKESIYIDANSDKKINEKNAKKWIGNYQEDNQGKIWYHFFGYEIFNEITSDEGFTHFNINNALNDEGKPQVILTVWGGQENNSARIAGAYPTTYDASNPCPPCPR
jgi:hypothetical protein